MKKLASQELLTLRETMAEKLFESAVYPWQALLKLHTFILQTGVCLKDEDYERVEETVWIARSAKVESSARIIGPTIIGHDAEIRHCAFIRGNVMVGAGAVVGNSTELKNAILFNEVQVPHYNYIGDSVLGYRAHMGAGAVTSNVKADKKPVTVKTPWGTIETGMEKLGAILGDRTEIGCGTVLNPGTVVGRNTNIYPLSAVRGYVPENSIYKNQGEIVEKLVKEAEKQKIKR